MAPLRLAIAVTFFVGCVHHDQTVDQAFPEPTVVAGPPGGQMDPSWQPGGDASDPSGYAASGEVVASADPSAAGYVMGAVSDTEIDQTLEGYGEWVDVDGYGEVWRPYATEVGVDFTPYETCGSWVWTDDWGWVYGCDYSWGWLPFHYGQWGWFDDYWAWVPDYEWSPAWVDWRSGGGYVGWRPQAPVVRDHRHHHQGPVVRDHRTHHGMTSVARVASLKESQWRFAATADFGKPHIRSHLFRNPAEGLRVTQIATRPPFRGTVQPVKAASIMRGRLAGLEGHPIGQGPIRSRQPSAETTHMIQGAYVSGAVPPGHAQSFGADESDDPAVYAPGGAANPQGSYVGGTSGDAVAQPYRDGMRSGGQSNVDPTSPQHDGFQQVQPTQMTPDQPVHERDGSQMQPQSMTPTQPVRDRDWSQTQSQTMTPGTPVHDRDWSQTQSQTMTPDHDRDWSQQSTPVTPGSVREPWSQRSPLTPSQTMTPQAQAPQAQDRPTWMTHQGPPTWHRQQPAQPTWTPSQPSQTWTPSQSSQPTYHPQPSQPAQTWTPSHSSSWSPPASHSSSSWSPPASSSWSPPPSHSSGGSFGGGGHSTGGMSGGSFSGGGHSTGGMSGGSFSGGGHSGGGGHHR